jgi:uncharacterized protein YdeI (YjbR/CyaY-like superfamily)
MPTVDPRIDAYIKSAAPFARPILSHLRTIVRTSCPDAQETMKWGHPHFDYKGIFCGMAAFKEHAAFNFWKGQLLSEKLPKVDEKAMGQFGRITSVADLPSDKTLSRLIKTAAKLNDEGVKVKRMRPGRKAPLSPPADLLAALKKNKKAQTTYEAFPPGQQREYIEWVTEAKQEATRAKRLATAIEWMAEGKQRNWKYMK